MKVSILIEDPVKDRELVEPLMQRFKELFGKHGIVHPCIIEFENGVISVVTDDSEKKEKTKHKKKKKVA